MTVLCLDHVGIMGADLAAMGRAYETLGFQLTPVSQQSGSLKPGDPVTMWGSANRCAMLPEGYIELLGIIDPARYDNRIGDFVRRYPGAHIAVFGCDDPEAEVVRLRGVGFKVVGLTKLQRMIVVDGQDAQVRFSLVRMETGAMAEGRVQMLRHETPALMWRPELTVHANGARRLDQVIIAVDDLGEAVDRYTRFLGMNPRHDGPARHFDLPRGRCTLVAGARLGDVIPGATAPTLPYIAAMRITAGDLVRAAALPGATRAGDDVIIPAARACGTTIMFSAA